MCPEFGPGSFIEGYDTSGEFYYRELESKNLELSRDLSILMLRIEGLKEDVEQVCCSSLSMQMRDPHFPCLVGARREAADLGCVQGIDSAVG
jgi:hypothetical protein